MIKEDTKRRAFLAHIDELRAKGDLQGIADYLTNS